MDLQFLSTISDPHLIEMVLCLIAIGALRWINHLG